MRTASLDQSAAPRSLYVPALVLSVPALLPLSLEIAASLFLFLALLPLAHTVFVTRQVRVLDPLVMVSCMYALGVPLPILLRGYLNDRILAVVSSADLTTSLLWSYRGFSFFLLAYMAAGLLTGRQRQAAAAETGTSTFSFQTSFAFWIGVSSVMGTVAGFIMDGGIASTFMAGTATSGPSSLRQLVHHVAQLGYGYFFLYWIMRIKKVRVRGLDALFIVLVVLHAIMMVAGGSKTYFFSLMACLLVALDFADYRFTPRKAVLFLLAVVSIYFVFSIVSNFRMISRGVYFDESQEFTEALAVHAENFWDATKMSVAQETAGSASSPYTGTQNIFQRLTSINSFVKLIQLTEGRPPYENAFQSLLSPLYAFLPSALGDVKANFFDSGDFASMFGWSYGGISVTLIGSFYWAWGYAGICFGMALTGALFCLVVRKARSLSPPNLYAQVLYITLLLHLVNLGRTFQSTIIDVLRIWAILLVIAVVRKVMTPHRTAVRPVFPSGR